MSAFCRIVRLSPSASAIGWGGGYCAEESHTLALSLASTPDTDPRTRRLWYETNYKNETEKMTRRKQTQKISNRNVNRHHSTGQSHTYKHTYKRTHRHILTPTDARQPSLAGHSSCQEPRWIVWYQTCVQLQKCTHADLSRSTQWVTGQLPALPPCTSTSCIHPPFSHRRRAVFIPQASLNTSQYKSITWRAFAASGASKNSFGAWRMAALRSVVKPALFFTHSTDKEYPHLTSQIHFQAWNLLLTSIKSNRNLADA